MQRTTCVAWGCGDGISCAKQNHCVSKYHKKSWNIDPPQSQDQRRCINCKSIKKVDELGLLALNSSDQKGETKLTESELKAGVVAGREGLRVAYKKGLCLDQLLALQAMVSEPPP